MAEVTSGDVVVIVLDRGETYDLVELLKVGLANGGAFDGLREFLEAMSIYPDEFVPAVEVAVPLLGSANW